MLTMSGESGAKSVEYDGAKCTDSDQSVAFDDGDVNVDGNSSDEESSTCVVSARRSHSSVPVSDHSRGGLSFSISRLLSDRASGCKDVDVGSDDRENSDEDMETTRIPSEPAEMTNLQTRSLPTSMMRLVHAHPYSGVARLQYIFRLIMFVIKTTCTIPAAALRSATFKCKQKNVMPVIKGRRN